MNFHSSVYPKWKRHSQWVVSVSLVSFLCTPVGAQPDEPEEGPHEESLPQAHDVAKKPLSEGEVPRVVKSVQAEAATVVPKDAEQREPTLKESSQKLFAEIERLRWRIDTNTELLQVLKAEREKTRFSDVEIVVQMEREKTLSEGLKRDASQYLSLLEKHRQLEKQIEAQEPKVLVQPPMKTVVDADVIEAPVIEEKKRIRGAASSLFETIDTSSPIEGETSVKLFKKTIQEISEEQ